MQHRMDKINEGIKRDIAAVIREVKDPRVAAMTSVVGVATTKDLKQAKVFVSVMGNESEQKETLNGLKSAGGFIRRELGERIDLHFTPELIFVLDHSMETGAKINSILKDIQDKS
ncbi:MAG: 30S ribosome-binding factor RbfA [Clostridiales bacterium]|nr:30S ribosome-binding factor RbfA [Clostridiales bacterium]